MITNLRTGDFVITDRGGVIENRYGVHAAVTDAQGKILFAVGDPTRMTLARSAAKPAQSLAVLETGGFDKFGFDEADLALMCASHSSEDRHLTRARHMLYKIHAEERDLRCGGHPALSAAVNRDWIKQDYEPTAICNNCSGKHAGMLAASKAIDTDISTYHLQSHPIQQRVKKVYEDLCGLDADGVKWGIDGCNLPAPASPLHVLAKVYAFFASAADRVEAGVSNSTREEAASRVFNAMARYPDMVAGDGRFCTGFMQLGAGNMIGKLGADGCYGIGLKASDATRRLGSDGAVGIAVKIEDGHEEILYSAVMEILKQLEISTPEMVTELAGFHRKDIYNTVGVVTGHYTHTFEIRSMEGLEVS